MPNFNELEAISRALGEKVAAHERARAYFSARIAAQKDADAQRLMREYQQQVERVQRMEMERRPIEVADKKRLVELEQQVAGQPSLKALMQTQADYMELMTRVHQSMEEPLLDAAGLKPDPIEVPRA